MMNNRLEVVLPVYNEEKILEENVLKVREFLNKHNFKFVISIVDNGSVDKTFRNARNLEKTFSGIFAFRLEEKGRGRALKSRILNSSCPLLGYMDIDLSAGLPGFLEMYQGIQDGYDITMGSRLLPLSAVKRSVFRESLSRIYSKVTRGVLDIPFFDYQCGFKLFRRESVLSLMPLIRNDNWFFDTELVFRAYKKGLKIKEIPVEWNERKKGKVKLLPTIIEDIKGIARLKFDHGL